MGWTDGAGGEIPSWCRWRAGRGPVLVVAPHGGRRTPSGNGEGGAKVNDLYTADLADELARALDASLIANDALDRNDLDLNRLSQIRGRAPWFVELVASLLARILQRHATAELLLVHGWNVVQPKCDLGVGATLDAGDLGAPEPGELTVSPHYVAGRLNALRTHCAAAGIDAAYGERYPGRHRNNVLQLFRRDGDRASELAPQIAQWAAAGRIEAVQLELGIPIRWPGSVRRQFIGAATEAFTQPPVLRVPPATRAATMPATPAALQFCDPRSSLGLMGRVDAAPGGSATEGRLLLFAGADRVALFTGEEVGRRRLTGGPHFVADARGLHLTFGGTLLATDDGRRYVDLETAFAASRLCTAAVDVAFHPGPTADYGRVRGTIHIDGVRYPIDAYGFTGHAAPARVPGTWRSHAAVSAGFGPELALRLHHRVPGTPGVIERITPSGRVQVPLARLAVSFDGDPYTPRRFAAGAAAAPLLIAEPLSRMAITRPIGRRTVARVTFGTARVRSPAHGDGFGFYEYARALV